MKTKQLEEDLKYTWEQLTDPEKEKLKHSVILITGASGFLGFYFMHFLYRFRKELELKKVICLDNFVLGRPEWLDEICQDKTFACYTFDIIGDAIDKVPDADKANLIIHMASIASPTFYRKFPIETVDANVWGLRNLLDYYKERQISGFLFFSSSEVYGDPSPDQIPLKEGYNGNVSPVGPRACYDEAKRFGETLCMLFSHQYQMPIGVVRPFNNYGPGMKLNDRRVPADFAANIIDGKDLTILSSGSPTRTFCYIADAMAGYLKVLLYGSYDYFNIGIERPEISILQLAELYRDAGRAVFGYKGDILYAVSEDHQYLTHNPQRRCPDIGKAQHILGYDPKIKVEEGIHRFLTFLKDCPEVDRRW